MLTCLCKAACTSLCTAQHLGLVKFNPKAQIWTHSQVGKSRVAFPRIELAGLFPPWVVMGQLSYNQHFQCKDRGY